jgi:serine/threonine protein kinase
VARGLRYLHNNQLVHGDLKPVSYIVISYSRLKHSQANILINEEDRAELGDSGLLPLIQQDEFVGGKTITTSFTNSARYMAPELVRGEQSPTFATDVYALACVGYQVCLRSEFLSVINVSLISSSSRILLMRILRMRSRRPSTRYTDRLAEEHFRHLGLIISTKSCPAYGIF